MGPQAPEQIPVSFETGRHYKVHRSYVWLGPIIATISILVIVALNGMQGIIRGIEALHSAGVVLNAFLTVLIIVAIIAGVYGIICLIYALSYKYMSFVFDEREFSFYSGIIVKRRVHLPYIRVQSVNHRASIIQRIAGVCTVTIDSAGGSSNKALRIPFLRLSVAEQLRTDIFVRKAAVESGLVDRVVYAPNGDGTFAAEAGPSRDHNVLDKAAGAVADWRGIFGGAASGLEPVTYEFGLSNKELLLASSSHSAPIVTAVLIGMSVSATAASFVLTDSMLTPFIGALTPIAVLSFVGSWLLGVLMNAIVYGKYHCCRRGSRIEVQAGLLQRRFTGIDVSRIQSVEIRQSLIRHLLGYCEISVGRVKAAGDDKNKQSSISRGLVIHPFVKMERVDEILAGLLPEMESRPHLSEISNLPPAALPRALKRRCLLMNPCAYAMAIIIIAWVVLEQTPEFLVYDHAPLTRFVFLIALIVFGAYTAGRGVGAVNWARKSGHVWSRDYLLIHNSGWSTASSLVPRRKIQAGYTLDQPFQRRIDLTSLVATTAAGTSRTTTKLYDVTAETGAAYLDWIKPRHESA
jgi:putative membrane protein